MYIFKSNTPRWIVFVIDVVISIISFFLAFLLRFNFDIPPIESQIFPIVFPIYLLIRISIFIRFRTYAGIIRYTSYKDAERIFFATLSGAAVMLTANLISYLIWNEHRYLFPISIVIIDLLLSNFLLTGSRAVIKVIYFEFMSDGEEKKAVIYGAGDSGAITKRTLDRDIRLKYKVVAFIDGNKRKIGKKLEGVEIFHPDELESILTKKDVDNLIISVDNLSKETLNRLTEVCIQHNVKVLNVPPASQWINGELSFNQIRSIKIEDLLGRIPINLDNEQIKKQVKDRVVLVTGAAGSIGSELARQLTLFKPKQLLLLDQAESPLYEIELEIKDAHPDIDIEVVIGDIRNKERIENLFSTFKPELVYHAAAYKHVPLMENNPSEAILTNILGTKNVAELAIKYGVKTFVMISTDKAVNPTNVMGASKRIAEIYTQSLNDSVKTVFITTRFGNVLGSSGSVIPLFKRQIEKGGPITVTDPEVTRYFMTIPEACQLVLEAATMGKGGEIYLFDMGESVKIVDLAKKMIKLSGLELDKDIRITFTGLRPGEKLYEELLNDKENAIPTHHPQIMIAKVRTHDFETISREIKELIRLFNTQDNIAIVKLMKKIVPEFKSHNSVYADLD